MEYATLNNGVKMPMAGIGTFLLTPDEAEASVLSALQCGYRLIDTANAYVNEKAVGRAMKKSGVERRDIFLETKLWPSFYEQADAVDKTLERLDTDYIDLLLIHQPSGNYVAGYDAAWPVEGFVTENDFTGKTVIPFCTSSSSGIGESGERLAGLAGTGDWLEGERFRSSASDDDVQAWVDSLDL